MGVTLKMCILSTFVKETYMLNSRLKVGIDSLLPFKAQLTWTDGVIDQIVYRLYGLTAEEINVVEGVNG